MLNKLLSLIYLFQEFLKWRITNILKQDRKILSYKELGFQRYIMVYWDLLEFFGLVIINPYGFIISCLPKFFEYKQIKEETKKRKRVKKVDLNSLPPSIRRKLEKAEDELSKEGQKISAEMKKTAEFRNLKIKLDRRMRILGFLLLIQVLSWISLLG